MLKTATKILIARGISRALLALRRLAGKSAEARVVRRGIHWHLDLREGIDLAIYLGAYERETLSALAARIRPGNVVVDIGANIGALTLPIAAAVGPGGKVLAFEPTAYAFGKLRANAALNPELAPRIVATQAMLVDRPDATVEKALYSSWPLSPDGQLHPVHQGQLMSLAGATSETLDGALAARGVTHVDLMKLDVDGHELKVLEGALQTLRRSRPLLIMELAPYTLDETPGALERILELLGECGYVLRAMSSGRELPHDAAALRSWIPPGCGLNIIGAQE